MYGNNSHEPIETERLTVSVEEAGRILGISRGAAYAHAKDGSIPTIRLGKRLLVPKAALHELLTPKSTAPEEHSSKNAKSPPKRSI
jgi:excisionase family DNA binding protein